MNFKEQMTYEELGAKEGLRGATRKDCPFNRETQPGLWNHWVYGCEIAAGEKAIIESGSVTFCSTGNDDGTNVQKFTIPVNDAIELGQWKPRFVSMVCKSTDDFDR